MPITAVTDTRKRAANPPTNKIVTTTLPAASAPADLGPPKTQPKGAPPPSVKTPRLLLTMCEPDVEWPEDGTLEAKIWWSLARRDLDLVVGHFGASAELDKAVAAYRAAGKPIGFLSEEPTDPEGTDEEARAAHAGADDLVNIELDAAARAYLDGQVAGASVAVLERAQALDPMRFEEITAELRREAAKKNVAPGASAAPTPRRWSKTKRETAATMLREGAPLDAVSQAVNMPLDAVAAYAAELGAQQTTPATTVVTPDGTALDVAKDGAQKDVTAEVYKTQLHVQMHVLNGAPDLDALGEVLREREAGTYADEEGKHRPYKLDELVTRLEKRLYAARWLAGSGAK